MIRSCWGYEDTHNTQHTHFFTCMSITTHRRVAYRLRRWEGCIIYLEHFCIVIDVKQADDSGPAHRDMVGQGQGLRGGAGGGAKLTI